MPSLEAQLLELPYQQSNMTMFVLLPNEYDGLSDLLNRLNIFNFNDLNNQQYYQVNVSMPRFSVDFSTNLNQALTNVRFDREKKWDLYFSDYKFLLACIARNGRHISAEC